MGNKTSSFAKELRNSVYSELQEKNLIEKFDKLLQQEQISPYKFNFFGKSVNLVHLACEKGYNNLAIKIINGFQGKEHLHINLFHLYKTKSFAVLKYAIDTLGFKLFSDNGYFIYNTEDDCTYYINDIEFCIFPLKVIEDIKNNKSNYDNGNKMIEYYFSHMPVFGSKYRHLLSDFPLISEIVEFKEYEKLNIKTLLCDVYISNNIALLISNKYPMLIK